MDNTSRYEELAEGGGELLPHRRVIRQLRGLESLPPGTYGPQKQLGRKVHLLLVGHSEQPKLLLQRAKPVLHLQRLVRWRERGWVGFEEVLVRGLPLKTASTTPIPTVASRASTGETREGLCHNLHGTSCLLTSSG